MSEQVDRLDAVKCQIEMAIRSHLQYDDLASAITLAGAAERVLSDLQPNDGVLGVDSFSIRGAVNLLIKPEHQKEASSLFSRSYDQLRHADREPTHVHELSDTFVDALLVISIGGYARLATKLSPLMLAHLCWVGFQRPNWMKVNVLNAMELSNLHKIAGISKAQFFIFMEEFISDQTIVTMELGANR